MRSVLSVDPGGTNGYALFVAKDNKSFHLEVSGQASDPMVFLDEWGTRQPKYVVAEKYFVKFKHQSVYTAEIIGMCKYCARKWGAQFVIQEPAIKAFVNNAILKKRKLWNTGEHERDAIRHGLYFIKVALCCSVIELTKELTSE